MTYIIRKATSNDRHRIISLIQQLASESKEQSSITQEYVDSYLEKRDSHVLVAESEGRVQGLLSYSIRPDLYHAGNSALIEELVIEKSYRGQGLGSALLSVLLEDAKELDCKEICLAVMPDNERAVHFYRSHGLNEEALFLEKHL